MSQIASAQPRSSPSVCSGRADVVKSRSLCCRPSIASRTGPPTRASSWPASRNRRPSSSITGAIRSSSAPTDSLHLGDLEGRQGRRRTRQETLSAAAVRRRCVPSGRPMRTGYSRGHASPAVAAPCPRGGAATLAAAAGARRRPSTVASVPRAERGRSPAAPGQDRRPPRRSSATRSRHDRSAHPVHHPDAGSDPGQGHRSPTGARTPSPPINLHAFIVREPINDQRRAGRGRPADPPVRREPDHRPGTFDSVDELRPGQSSTFTIRVPRSRVDSTSATRPASTGSACTPSATASRPATTPPTAGPARSSRSCPRTRRRQDRAGHPAAALASGTRPTAASRTSTAGPSPRRRAGSAQPAGVRRRPPATRPVSWLVDPAVPDTVRAARSGQPPALARRHDRDRRARRGRAPVGRPSDEPEGDREGEDEEQPSGHRRDRARLDLAEPARRRARRRRAPRPCRTATSTSPRPPSSTPTPTTSPAAQRQHARPRGASPSRPRRLAERLPRPGGHRRSRPGARDPGHRPDVPRGRAAGRRGSAAAR